MNQTTRFYLQPSQTKSYDIEPRGGPWGGNFVQCQGGGLTFAYFYHWSLYAFYAFYEHYNDA